MADGRSPQVFARTRANTRELLLTDKQNPQLRTVGDSMLVVECGTEPASVRKLVVPALEQTADFADIFRTEMAGILVRFDAADWMPVALPD